MTTSPADVFISALSPHDMGEISKSIQVHGEYLLHNLVTEPTETVSALAGLDSTAWCVTEARLVAELANAPDQATRNGVKRQIPAFVPARFDNDRRRTKGHCLGRQVIGHDFDHLNAETFEAACESIRAKLPGRFLAIHTTATERNADGTWRLRVFELLDREASPDEWEARVKPHMRSLGEHDANAVDITRLLYLPIKTACYHSHVFEGPRTKLDELASMPSANVSAPVSAVRESAPPAISGRRKAAARLLAGAWPALGSRHGAKGALAGALHRDRWSEDEAVDFMRELYAHVESPDGGKSDAAVRSTYARAASHNVTGWTTLTGLMDAGVVDAARRLLSFGAVEERHAEFDAATLTRAHAEPLPAPTDGKVTVDGWAFDTSGLDAPLPPLEFQIAGLICKGDVVMLVAQGNSLKTWLSFSIALAVATGRPWLDRFAALRGRACILDYESGDYEVKRRLKLLGGKDEHNVLRSSYSGKDLSDPEKWLTLAKLQLDLLIIDSFHAAAPGVKENEAESDHMLQHAGSFANATGCTVIVIHHSRKGSGGDRRESVRGSTALFAACDRIFEFDELEKCAGGVVRTALKSIKDGAGRRPEDFRVELSDQGLRFVEEGAKTTEEKPEDANRARVTSVLKGHSAGVPKADLLNMLKGKTETRRALLSALLLAGITREFKADGGKVYVMLNPHLEH